MNEEKIEQLFLANKDETFSTNTVEKLLKIKWIHKLFAI